MEYLWTVYMLRVRTGELYCGIAKDVAKRLEEHNAGKGSKFVKSRLPAKVVWQEPAGSLGEALRREREIKKLTKVCKEALVENWKNK